MNAQEMKLDTLFALFDDRKGLSYSDCLITERILTHFTQGEDSVKDKRVMDWVVEQIRNPRTIPLVRNLLKRFFENNKENLSQKKQDTFERAIQESELIQDIPKLLREKNEGL